MRICLLAKNFLLHGGGLSPANPSSTTARGHQQSSNITLTEHVHRPVFMLCSCYVYAMFMI